MGKPLFPKVLVSIAIALSPLLFNFPAQSKTTLADKSVKEIHKHGGHPWKAQSMSDQEREVSASRMEKWFAANQCIENTNYSEAIKIYTELIDTADTKTKPEQLAFLYGQRGYARMLKGDLKTGVVDASKSLQIDPNSMWMRKNRAVAYRKLGQIALAKADEDKARQLINDPNYLKSREVIGHYKGAMEARNQDRPEEAILHAKQLIKSQPDSNAPYFILGDAYFEIGDFKEALKAFNQSLKMMPNDPYVLNYRGATYAQIGEVDKAIADYSSVIEIRKKASSKQWDVIVSRYAGRFLAPSLGELYAIRGELYLKQGERDKAVGDCSEAIKLNPADDKARFVRATVYKHFKQSEKALTDLDELIKVNPKDEKALQYKAEILLDLGKPNEAITAITRAIALDDKDWHSFEIRAQCHQMAGHGKLAAQDIHHLNQLRNPKY